MDVRYAHILMPPDSIKSANTAPPAPLKPDPNEDVSESWNPHPALELVVDAHLVPRGLELWSWDEVTPCVLQLVSGPLSKAEGCAKRPPLSSRIERYTRMQGHLVLRDLIDAFDNIYLAIIRPIRSRNMKDWVRGSRSS